MSTPISGTSAYCTVSQLLERYDVRVLGDLLSDNGQRIDPVSILTNATLSDLLKEASGDIEAAVLMAERYTVADLLILNGNSQQLLVGMCAALAVGKIPERRLGAKLPPDWERLVDKALAKLEALAQGSRIFALQEAAAAGLSVHDKEEPSDVENRNLTTFELSRWLGRRNNRYQW